MANGRAPRATEPEIISAVAHELHSPVAALKGAAEKLRSDEGLDASTRARLLDVIEQAGDHLLRLADDLAVATSASGGRLAVVAQPCDAAAIAGNVLAAIRASHRTAPGIALVAPEGLPPVAADPARLRQVVANLVDNALDHGGRSDGVTVTLSAGPTSLRIAVSDEGPGIPAEARERVFEPYERLGPRAGSGLGLWVVRELVTAMDGTVTLESPPEGGATFSVELPLAAPPVGPPRASTRYPA